MSEAGGPVTAIVHAGGPHVLPLLGRVEELLREVAGGHGPVLAEHASSTISAVRPVRSRGFRPLRRALTLDRGHGVGSVMPLP